MKKFTLLFVFIWLWVGIIPSHANFATARAQGFAEGYLYALNDTSVQLEEYDGTMISINLRADVYFSIDGTYVNKNQFRKGMEIYVHMQGNNVSYIEGFSTSSTNYIAPQSKTRKGFIKNVDREQLTIRTSLGKDETYTIAPMTILQRNGINTKTSELYMGDRVKLYFDKYDSPVIRRMEVEGKSIAIGGIYKGMLSVVDDLDDSIFVKNIEKFTNGEWATQSDTMKLDFRSDYPIYVGGYKISYQDLQYYKGKMTYMIYKDYFGRPSVDRLVVKDQNESNFSAKIEDINWFSETMELSNKKNLNINDGTIVIKNNRIVDKYSITKGSDAFIIGDGRNSNVRADLVYIYNEDINNTNIGNYHLYIGRLDEIFKDKVNMDRFYVLNNHSWESFRENKELFYDNDIYAFDMESKKKITNEEFYSKDYAVDEDSDYAKDKGLKDWYGYIYADGDRIVAIGMFKKLDSIANFRTTLGTVESNTKTATVGYRISLKDVRDFSERKETWMPKTASINVITENAVIIKADKIIKPEELKIGDRLYVVRDSSIGKMILVK